MHIKRPTWKVLEQLPEPPIPVDDFSSNTPSRSPSEEPAHNFVWQAVRSATNTFGLFREFPSKPLYSPDNTMCLKDISHPSLQRSAKDLLAESTGKTTQPSFGMFKNLSSFLLMDWLWTGSHQKSIGEAQRLVDVLRTPGFSLNDMKNFDVARETALFDKQIAPSTASTPSFSIFSANDGWENTDVMIKVPDGRTHRSHKDPPVPKFRVSNFFHRSITSIIHNVWSSNASKRFHLTPFRQYWQRDSKHIERIYGKLYASDSFADAHEDVQTLSRESDDTHERVVCALMFWSDSTHLSSFGSASLWPIYLFFGNESKYTRSSMQYDSCHHIAYVPKVCDNSQQRLLNVIANRNTLASRQFL
jgi:hypothetical protein